MTSDDTWAAATGSDSGGSDEDQSAELVRTQDFDTPSPIRIDVGNTLGPVVVELSETAVTHVEVRHDPNSTGPDWRGGLAGLLSWVTEQFGDVLGVPLGVAALHVGARAVPAPVGQHQPVGVGERALRAEPEFLVRGPGAGTVHEHRAVAVPQFRHVQWLHDHMVPARLPSAATAAWRAASQGSSTGASASTQSCRPPMATVARAPGRGPHTRFGENSARSRDDAAAQHQVAPLVRPVHPADQGRGVPVGG